MRDRQNGYGRTASSARARRWCPLIVVLADEVPPARHMPGTGPEHRAESAPQLLLSQSWAPAHAGSSDTGPGCGRDRDPRLVCPAPCVAPTCRARRQAEREQVMYGAQNSPTGRPSKHGCGPAEGLQIRRDCAPHSCRAPITQRELGRRPGGSLPNLSAERCAHIILEERADQSVMAVGDPGPPRGPGRAERRQCARCSRRGPITQRDADCPTSVSRSPI